MISAFTNVFKIPELRARILFTLAMIVIVRVGAGISLPGVDAAVLREAVDAAREAGTIGGNAITTMVNLFSGGGLQNCAIFALGIMPYISASIMMQLLTAVVPSLQKLSREDGGRQRINMYTRYVTIGLCLIQGYMLAISLKNPAENPFLSSYATFIAQSGKELVPEHNWQFVFMGVLSIMAGTMLLMWIGEQITERGIGNGISLIICVNIVSDLPSAIISAWNIFVVDAKQSTQALILVLLIVFLITVIAGVIALTEAQRRIVVQYAKRVVGRKVYGGQSTFLPLKVNYSGVMPIIFASAITTFPPQILGMAFGQNSPTVAGIIRWLSPGHPFFYTLTGILIFFFAYFWVATMFQPNQIAEDLKKNGGYIPGVRPGKATADFLDKTMSRLTFAGAIFLVVLALLPTVISGWLKIPYQVSQFFGGTSILILVGVVLDVMRHAETHLLQRHYDGFLRKGKIRGRTSGRVAQTGRAASDRMLVTIWVVLGILVLLALTVRLAL